MRQRYVNAWAKALGKYPGRRMVHAVVRIDVLLLKNRPVGLNANIDSHGQPQRQVKLGYVNRPE